MRALKLGWPTVAEWPLLYATWDREYGAGWLRVFGYGLSLKAPHCRPLFSERYGYKIPWLRLAGWRLFPLTPGRHP